MTPAAPHPRSKSAASTSITAIRTRCRASISLSTRACSRWSAATAWARPRCARRIMGLLARKRRLDPRPRRGHHQPVAGTDRAARRRLCSAGPPAVALAQRRRASAARRRHPARALDRRAHLRDLSAPRRTQEQRRRPAFRRRAADACDLARAADQSASAGHGRADRRAWRPSSSPRSRRCWCGLARKATSRCSSSSRTSASRRRSRRTSPSWSMAASTASSTPAASRRTANCSSGCSASASMPRRARRRSDGGRSRGRCPRNARRARRPIRIYVSNPTLPTRWSQPVPIARIEAAARTLSTGVTRLESARGNAATPAAAAGIGTSRRARRRHARHQGRGTPLHPRHHRRKRPAHAPGRRLHQRQALDLRCPGAGDRAQPWPRRLGACSAPIAAPRSRRWRRPSPNGCAARATSPASSRPAARAARRWSRRACARCRSACPS